MRPSKLLIAGLLATTGLAAACGGADETESSDPWAAAIPTAQMLSLSADGSGDASQQALGADANDLAAHARSVMARLDDLRNGTHQAIERLVTATVPTEVSRGATTCKVWETDAQNLHWQLISCLNDRRTDRYAFVLRGRPASSTADGDYLPVFAGAGRSLERYDGQRRGAGMVGYNFDNVATLTGADVSGRLGIGYRAAGRARQLVLGLDAVTGPQATEAVTGLYRFEQILGVGGRFVFATHDDFLTRDGNDELISGEDGVAELGRVAMAWNPAGAARTLAIACGGTVGEGTCVHVAQCWTASGENTHSDVSTGEAVTWNESACPGVEVGAPEGDEAPPASGGDAGAPQVGEPGPIDGE